MASEKVTVEQLFDAVTAGTGMAMLPNYGTFAEVYPGVFLAPSEIAMNKIKVEEELKITHVLNTAEGSSPFQVNTGPGFYSDDVTYLGLGLLDEDATDLSPVLEEAADFIDSGLKSGGRVLVNCVVGASRSAALVIAFLMLRRGMRGVEAAATVRSKRLVCPNDGFLAQLCDLDHRLYGSSQG